MVTQVPEAVTEALRQEFRDYMKQRPDLTSAHFASHTTLAEVTVRSWIAGTIPGGTEVQAEMRRVLQQAKAGDILTPGGPSSTMLTEDATKRVRKVRREGNFYKTQTASRIADVLTYCADQAVIGVITADFGVGKTLAVKQWRASTLGKVESAVFEFNTFSCTDKRYFMVSMGKQLGIDIGRAWQNGGQAFDHVCEHLRRYPCLLIFDQCEALRPQIHQIIRQIWDRTSEAGVGVVMLGAPILLARLRSGKMVDLGALESRVALWAPLLGLSKSEMAAVVKAEGFDDDVEESAFELWYRATAGSMRRLMRSLDLMKAKHAGRRVTEKTVVGVAAHLWGMNINAEVGE